VVSPMAETTTTMSSPARRRSAMRWATRLMCAAVATEEPPYFCTVRVIACPLSCAVRNDFGAARREVDDARLDREVVRCGSLAHRTGDVLAVVVDEGGDGGATTRQVDAVGTRGAGSLEGGVHRGVERAARGLVEDV